MCELQYEIILINWHEKIIRKSVLILFLYGKKEFLVYFYITEHYIAKYCKSTNVDGLKC